MATRITAPYIQTTEPRTPAPTPAPGAIVGQQDVLNPLAIIGAFGALAGLLGGADGGFSTEEASLDYFGLGYFDREGNVSQTRTTEGTGLMAAGTFRAWDPLQQGYYGIMPEQGQAFKGMTFAPGNAVPGGATITKAWVTHAVRKDNSLATTQMAMSADGRMHSLSETGVMKSWRPYKSIVIGKSLTTSNVRRVSRRIKSHVKSLRKVLSVLK